MWHHVYCFSNGLLKVEENKTHHQSSCRWKRWETHTRCHQKAGERQRKEGDSYCFSNSQRAERIDLKGAERWNQSFRMEPQMDGVRNVHLQLPFPQIPQVGLFVLRMSVVVKCQGQTHNCRHEKTKGPSVFRYSFSVSQSSQTTASSGCGDITNMVFMRDRTSPFWGVLKQI